eukprot:1495176-Amphidinium_carterae.1
MDACSISNSGRGARDGTTSMGWSDGLLHSLCDASCAIRPARECGDGITMQASSSNQKLVEQYMNSDELSELDPDSAQL